MRERIYWWLLGQADRVTDVAFSRKGGAWQRVFLLLSNLIDGIAWLAMSEEMRNRPATVAPSEIRDSVALMGRASAACDGLLEGDVLSAVVQRSQNDDFALGDLVTRDGSDLHLVTYLTGDGFTGDFLCVQAPETGWIEVGETETNLARRYSFVRMSAPGEFEVSNATSHRSAACGASGGLPGCTSAAATEDK